MRGSCVASVAAILLPPSPHMPDSDRRRKMISLRLSEVEYEVLRTQYRTYGARNVSDLARLALQRIMTGSAAPRDGFAAKLAELDERVHALESQLGISDPYAPVAKSEPL
jgi:hypothetical protein